jgi:hypothetical protein
VGKSFTTKEWLARIPEETWQELLRLHSRWNKIKFKNGTGRRDLANAPELWCGESKDDDDVLMPRSKGKRVVLSKGKR